MENLQYESTGHHVPEYCPDQVVFAEKNSESGGVGCCDITPIIMKNTSLSAGDSVEDEGRSEGFLKKGLRLMKKFNFKDLYPRVNGNRRISTDRSVPDPRLNDLMSYSSMKGDESPLLNKIDTLTQFTNIYPMFYR